MMQNAKKRKIWTSFGGVLGLLAIGGSVGAIAGSCADNSANSVNGNQNENGSSGSSSYSNATLSKQSMTEQQKEDQKTRSSFYNQAFLNDYNVGTGKITYSNSVPALSTNFSDIQSKLLPCDSNSAFNDISDLINSFVKENFINDFQDNYFTDEQWNNIFNLYKNNLIYDGLDYLYVDESVFYKDLYNLFPTSELLKISFEANSSNYESENINIVNIVNNLTNFITSVKLSYFVYLNYLGFDSNYGRIIGYCWNRLINQVDDYYNYNSSTINGFYNYTILIYYKILNNEFPINENVYNELNCYKDILTITMNKYNKVIKS